MNRRLGLACMAAMALTAAPANADVITSLFNTGLNASGGLLPEGAIDPHWTIVSNAEGTGSNAYVGVTTGYPIPGAWIPNQPNAQWIMPTNGAADNHAAGSYTYQTTFDLTGFDPTCASISFQVAADNRVTGVFLNGNNVGFSYAGPSGTGDDAYAVFSDPFTISNPAFFQEGINTLQFQVQNDAIDGSYCYDVQNPTGMMAVLCGKACPIPEPSTYAMVGAALGLFALRRRKSAA